MGKLQLNRLENHGDTKYKIFVSKNPVKGLLDLDEVYEIWRATLFAYFRNREIGTRDIIRLH